MKKLIIQIDLINSLIIFFALISVTALTAQSDYNAAKYKLARSNGNGNYEYFYNLSRYNSSLGNGIGIWTDGQLMGAFKSGKFGIGTTSPQDKLHVNLGAIRVSYISTQYTLFGHGSSNNGYLDNYGGGNLDFRQNADTKMSISNNGNVGIGTTSPSYKLQVAGDVYADGGWLRVSGDNGIYFENWGGGFHMSDSDWIRTRGNKNFYHNTGIMRTDGQLQVGPNGTRFVVNTDGNVGIGRNAPTEKLNVNGNIRLDNTNIYLRTGTDVNHGIGWYGTNKLFAGVNIDGPVVFGYSGGTLGTTSGGQKIALRWNNSGTVGIGTAPVSDIALKVQGSFDVSNSSTNTIFHVSTGKGLVFVGDSAYDQYIATGGSSGTSVIQDGDFSLWVSKGIVSEDLALVDVTDWSDFVFEKDYELRSLEEVAAYITTHGHLPEMPSEAEVKAQGYSVHDINKKLLQKIEELTLYTIQQEEKLKAQEKQFTDLEQRIKQLEANK